MLLHSFAHALELRFPVANMLMVMAAMMVGRPPLQSCNPPGGNARCCGSGGSDDSEHGRSSNGGEYGCGHCGTGGTGGSALGLETRQWENAVSISDQLWGWGYW